MHCEGQVIQLVARKRQMVVGLLDQLCQQVEITDTQFQTAKTRYEAVGAWLSSASSPHLDQMQIYPQGSIALGTAIKPLAANEFDVDLVCHLPSIGHTSSAQAVKQLVGARLKEHATYKGMLEEKQRCWRINYANEFHLDITPSILNPRCQQDGELVPDKTLAEWKPTNPKGYINRFEQYAAIRPRFVMLERNFAKATYDSVVPLPEPSMTKPFLKRIVQLLKRHRDQQFVGSSRAELAPISVIITTLAGWAYAKCASQQAYADEFDFITAVIREMPTFIGVEMRSGKPFYMVENETTARENFADKWNHDQRLATAFNEWHADALASIESLLHIEGVDLIAESLSNKFGGKKKETLSKFIAPIGQARSAGLLGIAPSIGLVASPSYGVVAVPKNTFFGR
jgi:Second Messenger Oligonucleotide or Dinucleotide Synthetase domain